MSYLFFENVSFLGAHLQKARLLGAQLSGANLSECYIDAVFAEDAIMRRVTSTYLSAEHANLRGADFSGARIETGIFDFAQINRTIFTGSHVHCSMERATGTPIGLPPLD